MLQGEGKNDDRYMCVDVSVFILMKNRGIEKWTKIIIE